MEAIAYRCQRCGAALEVTPETIVAVCRSCGYPNWFTNNPTGIEMLAVPRESLSKAFREVLARDKWLSRLGVELREAETHYIPFYFASIAVSTKYSGRAEVELSREECETVERYDSDSDEYVEEEECETETETVTVSVGGEYSTSFTLGVLARRNVLEKPLALLASYFRDKGVDKGLVSLDSVDWKRAGGRVLASEMGPGEAESVAKDQGCETLYSIVESMMNSEAESSATSMASGDGWSVTSVKWLEKRIPCKAVVSSITPLTLIPMIRIVYTYQGASYNIYLAGWDKRVLVAEKPLTAAERGKSLAVAVAGSGFLGGLGGAAAAMGGDYAVLGALLLVGGIAVNYKYLKKMTAEKKVVEMPVER